MKKKWFMPASGAANTGGTKGLIQKDLEYSTQDLPQGGYMRPCGKSGHTHTVIDLCFVTQMDVVDVTHTVMKDRSFTLKA